MRNLAASSRFAAEVETTRARVVHARALLVEARTYKRDRRGQFSSTGGGGGDDDDDDDESGGAENVLATKTVADGEGNEMDLSVIRDDDGVTRLHLGIGAEGGTEGHSVSLDRDSVAGLRDGLTTAAGAARTRQQEVKGLQAEADGLDARIREITQKTLGPETEHGRERIPLSEADAAEREALTRKWEELDERIGGLEGGDGEEVGAGAVPGRDGNVHYSSTVRLPASNTSVNVTITGGDAQTDSLSLSLRGADSLADTLGEMASHM